MPDLPPIPARQRKSRGWFHPLRWRFWCITLPVLFWTALAFLFYWPGLEYEYSAGNWFKLNRGRTDDPPLDVAKLIIGPVVIGKCDGEPVWTSERGFVRIDDSTASGIVYVWDNGMIGLNLRK